VFHKKIIELEIAMKKPVKDTAIDAMVELTANLKQEFSQYKSDSDDLFHQFDKIKNMTSNHDTRISELEEQNRTKEWSEIVVGSLIIYFIKLIHAN
jgi:protein-tyrosine-phosphatase